MIPLRRFLDDFAAQTAVGPATQSVSEADLETARLESFEAGYKAGWDDAISAQSDDKTRISSAFGQHLQDLSFTYHEAYAQVVNAMNPLLEQLATVLLPDMARKSLGPHIVEQLQSMAAEIGSLDVVIAVAPNSVDAVAPILEQDFGFPVRLIEDDTLADEQADIRFGRTERQIDLGELLTQTQEAVAAFVHDTKRKAANG